METLFQHFRKDEQPFIELVAGWVRETEDRYSPKLTDFLDPRQRFIVQSIVGAAQEIDTSAYGKFEEAERMRMYIHPPYFEPTQEDFSVTAFEITYPSKFLSLEHRDVLGALMSIGVDRSKFGDIRLDEERIQFTINSEMADYVQANLTTIGKAKVHLNEVSESGSLIPYEDEWLEELHIISSMRLDTVLSSVLNISRQKASMLIHGGRVKVNWTVREQPAFELQESDLLSVRGYGRMKIFMIEGRTKKDKIRLQIGRIE
ncbi:RNA-binding protein [Chungangia koreensis]|uniref:RNA-binding protein n=1 Tax=Chungangia koreensis TaxID=752657 RepID=A0ABV8X2S4_9LACT